MRDTWGLLCPRTRVQALSEAQANAWECLKIAAKLVPSLSPSLLVQKRTDDSYVRLFCFYIYVLP